ncbi:MAG: carbamoyltransferase HypF [Planctomycetes bacterium]|nr:carbamoyltransferase HypF [Planctomycetota bacterium]
MTDREPGPADTARPADAIRRRLRVRGQVQGVGFRPFVYRLATELALTGHVGNDVRGAFVEIEGAPERVERFIADLVARQPPLARITEVQAEALPVAGTTAFVIEASRAEGRQEAGITPDTATCADCLREMLDPADRRYRYPFTNCTNCGPRYSIIQSVPYDRPATTMAAFAMCPACRREYDDPADRRFHAQPNACPVCGPRVWFVDAAGAPVAGDAIAACAAWLRDGRIVALKGLGGFHLACRADSDAAVRELRRRKGRESKPLALMAADLGAARALGVVDAVAEAALAAPARPIVLLAKRPGAPVSRHVAPGTDRLGVMLPYTPLHALLLAEAGSPLVMTSGNPTDEPLCSENDEALRRLAAIADGFLLHDREIERRIDDSVVLPVGAPVGHAVPLRRARGYVPEPVAVAVEADRPVLAVGGELKSAVCLLTGREAVLSEHLGELPNAAAYRNFIGTIEQFKRLLAVEPEVIAHDLHPDYAATRHALRLAGEHVAVQHHHAHMVSVLAEHGLTGPAVGVICDGTGYGTDGTIWGCEILVGDERDFRRAGHLEPIRLAGGDAAARQTWRPAAALLTEAFGEAWPRITSMEDVDAEALALVRAMLARPQRLPRASSLGRLFDAVAFLLGLCDLNRHEAAAAMALEAAARRSRGAEPLAYALERADDGLRIDVRPMIRRLITEHAAGRDADDLALAFHQTAAAMLAEAACRAAETAGLDRAVLSGGCFANELLLTGLTGRLQDAGLAVYSHRAVPPGDGGLALGQAVVAAARTGR